jgi:hypothetical protein
MHSIDFGGIPPLRAGIGTGGIDPEKLLQAGKERKYR